MVVLTSLQAFAAPAKLAELVTGVNTAMKERLPPAVTKTRLYLSNPATRAILFRWVTPVNSLVLDGAQAVCGVCATV